jgi:hypothetical protein
MAGITFSIDDADIRAADRWLAATTGQLDFVTSRAIGATVKSIHGNLRRQLPSAIDRPTAWTRRGLLVRYPTRTNLTAAVGFNYGDGSFTDVGNISSMGTPAGRYMDVQARGGSRTAKASERALRRAGLAASDEFLTPANYGVGKLDTFGNVPAARYVQLLSRLRANRDIGTTSNAPIGPGSRGRTAAKRREVDVFVMRRNGQAAIMQRTGKGPRGGTGFGSGKPGRPQTTGYRRGIRPAFFLVRNPRYQVRFPVRQLAMQQFRREIGPNFTAALEWAQRNPKR